MRFTSDKKLLIDDAYLCNFMLTSGSEEFMDACETMLKTICILYENQTKQTKKNDDAVLTHRLNIFKSELLDSMSKQKVDTSDILTTLKTFNENQKLTLANIPAKIDDLRAKMDTIKEKIDVTKVVESTISKTNESLVYAMKNVSEQVCSMTSKVETFSNTRNTTRFKGEEGEKGLHDVLENFLPSRDGYAIIDTKSIPHSCDMVIKRLGYPDVRIESKAHGRDSGENVRTQEVKRFESDLGHLNSHGIFVSLYSGICGKGALEFEFLPATKKFAFYLSRNEFDGGIIAEIVRLIYKLDKFMAENENESDDGADDGSLLVSHDSILSIKSHLTDFNRKIEDLKTNAKNSLRILNEITLMTIEKLLTTSPVDMKPIEPVNQFECEKCNKIFKNKSGLMTHSKSCGKTS